VGENFAFCRLDIERGVVALLKFLNLWRLGWILEAESLGLFLRPLQLRLKCREAFTGVGAKDLAHLGKKIIIEKALDLIAPGVHDAVDAEVQLGVVELEEFGEQGLEFFKVLGHRLLISYASPSLG
jgi:hypothetical protein